MKTLRNLRRRPVRTALTIGGIVIGVFALVVMGAMAEKINLLVEGGERYYAGKITVTDANSPNVFFPQPMLADIEQQVRAVEGVEAAFAEAFVLIDKDELASFGPPAQLYGIQPEARPYDTFQVSVARGRRLAPSDRRAIVLGSDLVTKYDATVGETITMRGRQFTVVGTLEKQLNGVDTIAAVHLEDIQPIYRSDIASSLATATPGKRLASSITAYPKQGESLQELAKRIERRVPGVKALGPESFIEAVGSSTRIFNLIVISVSLISLVVGGLSVINTMMMSVSERVREIGIRKAVGATSSRIVRQFLLESATLSVMGGIIGIAFGALTVKLVNDSTADSALVLFALTERLVVGSLAFSLLLGVIAGLLPAIRAARLDPVQALRYQ